MGNIRDLGHVINGWKRYLKGETDPEAIRRGEICKGCKHSGYGLFEKLLPDYTLSQVQGLKCNACTCPLVVKIRAKEKTCPKNKW